MNYVFHPAASDEHLESVAYYESQQLSGNFVGWVRRAADVTFVDSLSRAVTHHVTVQTQMVGYGATKLCGDIQVFGRATLHGSPVLAALPRVFRG